MVLGWEGTVLHLSLEALQCVCDGSARAGVLLGKLWHKLVKHAHDVVKDKDLAACVGAGANADGGNAEVLRDLLCNLAWHHLQDDGEAASVLQPDGVLEKLERSVCAFTLHAVAAKRCGCLRSQANVPHDWDTGVDECFDLGKDGRGACAALELDGVGAALLHAAHAAFHCCGSVRVRSKRQVADDPGPVRGLGGAGVQGTGDCSAVVDHFIQGDLGCVVVTQHDLAQGVADQQHVHVCACPEPGRGVVVGGEHTQWHLLLVFLSDAWQGHD